MNNEKEAAKDEIRAPRTSRLSRTKNLEGGSISFEAYFLRDMYAKGRIDDALIREIIEENDLDARGDDVIAAISDPKGQSIPKGLERYIAEIADIAGQHN